MHIGVDERKRALPALPHLGHADVDGAEHDQHHHADADEPLLAGDLRPHLEQTRLEEPEQIADAEHDERPAGAALPGHAAPPGVKPHHSLPPRCLATLSRSLSPRPERLTTSRWSSGLCGAMSPSLASAWHGSSAGMMPSRRLHSWNAASASLSVAERNFTRPRSASQACSGPMPG